MKKAFLYYFISSFLYLFPLFLRSKNFQEPSRSASTHFLQISSLYKIYKKLFAISLEAFQNQKSTFSIISYKNTPQPTIQSSSQRFESFHFIRLSHELLKKNLFSSIHSQKYKYTPKPLPSILIHSKNSWRRRKRRRKSCWPQSTDPLSNRERRWDKLISIQSVVSTDVEPTLPLPPQWAQSPSRPTRSR